MRLFIGIPPDPPTRAALRETALSLEAVAPGRYVDASLYHITLAFLGELPAKCVPVIHAAMLRAAAGHRPFAVSLGPAGAFGSILWRGVKDDTALRILSADLRAQLGAVAIPYDPKPFRAHITLARESSFPQAARQLPFPGGTFTAGGMTLFESARERGIPCYIPRAEVQFHA